MTIDPIKISAPVEVVKEPPKEAPKVVRDVNEIFHTVFYEF